MPRPIRKQIGLDEESLNILIQELYNETFTMKSKINRLFIKWEQKAKEGGEIAAIGDQIIKCITAESKIQDQKLLMLKLIKEVVHDNKVLKNKENDDIDPISGTISSNRKNEILDLINKNRDENNKNFKKL